MKNGHKLQGKFKMFSFKSSKHQKHQKMKYFAPFVSPCPLRIHETLKCMQKDVSLFPPASRMNILSIATIKSSWTVLLFELVLLHPR